MTKLQSVWFFLKQEIAPKKKLTIPRPELTSALIATRSLRFVAKIQNPEKITKCCRFSMCTTVDQEQTEHVHFCKKPNH